MRRYFLTLLLVCGMLLLSRQMSAQATVNENLETQFLYVDAVNGSDQNSGTQTKPYKTINKGISTALANNSAGLGTRVTVNAGTYRETITLNGPLNTSLPITVEAATNGTAIVSGGVLYTGWTVYSGNSSIYTHSWLNNFGQCAEVTNCSSFTQPNIMLRSEVVAVDGTMLTQVLSLTQMMYPGTFYVDEKNNLIYVWPPSGTDMATAAVDVATEPALLTVYSNPQNLVFRGLVFQYANSCRSSAAATVNNATNILFDSDTFQYNNGQGLAFNRPTTYFTVQNSSALYNGDSGFQQSKTKYGLWSSNLAEGNNWRGAQGGYYLCNVAGQHAYGVHDDQLQNLTIAFNQTYGIHWDTDNRDITASGLIISRNLASGLFLEKSEGPMNISGSYVCNHTSAQSVGGVKLANSGYHGSLLPGNISFTDGFLYNNSTAQVTIQGQVGGYQVSDWETKKTYDLYTGNLTNTGNVIEGVGSGQILFSDSYLSGTDWTNFMTTFVSNTNDWWNASNSATQFDVPTSSTNLDLAGWQSTTLQDLVGSSFTQPTGSPFTPCLLSGSTGDYWITVDNSSVTEDPSGTAVYNLTITPLSGFSSTVNLSLDGTTEVSGLTGSLSASSITGGSGTAALTVTGATTTASGTYEVTVLANSNNLTHTVTMDLVVPKSSLRFSTLNLNFGNVPSKTTSPGMSFTITNFGTTSVKMTSYTPSASVWAISANTCPTSGGNLAAGKTCTITVTFSPNTAKSYTGTIKVVDGDTTSPQVVNLKGTGTATGTLPTVSFQPATLAFGNVEVGYSSSITDTITNSSSAQLTINSITLTGTHPGEYAIIINKCGSTLAAGASCDLTVRFSPTASDSQDASLTVSDNSSSGNDVLNLTGTGKYPTATLTPGSDDFGSVTVGQKSSAKTSTLTNTSSGTWVLNITKASLSGADSKDFGFTTTCGTTLNQNKSCTYSVTFAPSKKSSKSATLTVTDNTSSGSQTVSLSGTGK